MKKKKKSEATPRPQKVKKEKKPKSEAYIMRKNTGMKILRCILWVILIFVFVKGIVSIAQRDKEAAMSQMIRDFKANYSEFTNQNQEIMAFAQNFAREYLTYEARGEEEYRERLEAYVATNFFRGEIFDFKSSASALYVKSYRVEDYSTTQKDVYVVAEVEYTKRVLQDGQSYTEEKTTEQITLKVPVYCADSNYVVENIPLVVSDTVYLEGYSPEDYYGTSLDEGETAKVQLSVENFLTAYCEHDTSVINYYLDSRADKEKFVGLNGRFKFVEISQLLCYQGSAEVICLVEYSMQDRGNDAEMSQKANLTMKESGGKYYIVDMNTRTGNLNIN